MVHSHTLPSVRVLDRGMGDGRCLQRLRTVSTPCRNIEKSLPQRGNQRRSSPFRLFQRPTLRARPPDAANVAADASPACYMSIVGVL